MEGAEGELIELFVTEWPQSIDYCCSKAERRSGMRTRVRQPSRLQNSALCVKLKFGKKRARAYFFQHEFRAKPPWYAFQPDGKCLTLKLQTRYKTNLDKICAIQRINLPNLQP